MPSPKTGRSNPCGGCPPFDDNLCHALSKAIAAEDPQSDLIRDDRAQARRTVWRENETIARVPVICQGWAATAMALADGRRQIMSFLLPGDMVSAILVFEPVSHCSIEAITDIRYRSFQRDALQAAVRRHPDLFALVSRIWAAETARADRLTIDLGRRDAAERIASLILSLSDRLAQRGMMQGQTMDFPLRQHHIADAVGLTVVHVGNVLTEFRRTGLVEITGRSLTISDPVRLRRAAALT